MVQQGTVQHGLIILIAPDRYIYLEVVVPHTRRIESSSKRELLGVNDRPTVVATILTNFAPLLVADPLHPITPLSTSTFVV